MFDRAAIARPLGHCRVVGRSKQSREARGASGRSSMHVPTTNQENVRIVPCLAARRQQCAARRNLPHFFPGRWQSPYLSLIIQYWLMVIGAKYSEELSVL